MVGDFVLGVEASSNNDKENVLIQFWEASSIKMTEDGQIYWELTTQNKPFHIVQYGYNEALCSHRMQSVRRNITIQDDDELENDPQQIFIRRVFRNKMSDEWNTLKNKYPHKDFVISSGIRSCLYIPVYETAGDYYSGSSPCGVLEYVSTCEEHLEKFRKYLGLTFFGQKTKMYIYGDHLFGFGRLNILKHAVLEMDQLLTVVCQKFQLPLAQYWVTTHPHTEPLRVMYQQSHTEMKNLKFLDKFKQACMEMRLNKDEGLVGFAYQTGLTFYGNDTEDLSITNHHDMVQYASILSIPSFVVCLSNMLAGKCVLEFFLPPQEMISYNPQTLLNSLWETIIENLPSFKVATSLGEKLVQVSSVEVVNFSTQNEPQLFKLGQNSRNILVTEKDDTTIPVVNKTCQEAHTSKRENKPPEDINFESLREHFGRPLDDAAASFGVSRSTFKRICRVHGIKRWRNGKRTMNDNISSNLQRKLNDEEPSRRNFSRSSMPSSQDTVVAHTSQHLNKMTIKATYNRVTIRFELSDLSGIAELEDNVIERLHLEKNSFSIRYQDDEDDWILIACDKDVQECLEISRSLKKTTIKMSIDAPIINHHAP